MYQPAWRPFFSAHLLHKKGMLNNTAGTFISDIRFANLMNVITAFFYYIMPVVICIMVIAFRRSKTALISGERGCVPVNQSRASWCIVIGIPTYISMVKRDPWSLLRTHLLLTMISPRYQIPIKPRYITVLMWEYSTVLNVYSHSTLSGGDCG